MSRDVFVYSQRAAPISVDEMLAQMRARGIPVEWNYQFLSEAGRPADWTAGYLLPEGKTRPQVTITREPIEPFVREEILQAYADVLTETQRQALSTAQTRYQISVSHPSAMQSERMLVNLADILAETTDGMILKRDPEQFLNGQEYRFMYSQLLGN